MPVPARPKLYHITHGANLRAIIARREAALIALVVGLALGACANMHWHPRTGDGHTYNRGVWMPSHAHETSDGSYGGSRACVWHSHHANEENLAMYPIVGRGNINGCPQR